MITTAVIAAAALALPTLAAGWYLAPMIARRRHERRLRRHCAATGSLVLTFDDGPGADLTPRVLTLLRSRGARATFFLAGFRATERPRLVDAIAADGHELGCHAHNHLNAWRTGPRRAAADVDEGYRSLARWVPGDGIFRPPYGKMTLMTWATVRRRRAPIGWWTVVSGDVDDMLPAPEAVVERVRAAGGGVVLLHDFDRGPERAAFVLDLTRRLLETAAIEGWRVRTLGEVEGRARTDTGRGERHAA